MESHPIFAYNESMFGGTETMARGFIKNILPEMSNIHNYKCVIIPGYLPELRTWGLDGKQTVLWLHNTIQQFSQQVDKLLHNKAIANSIKYVIAVSEYHKNVLAKELGFSPEKIIVIPNAINMITPMPNKFENVKKVKIIHASSQDRGLEMLLNSIPLIEEDFELNVFNDFYPDTKHSYNLDAVNDPRINFWGKTPRKMVYKFMSEAHIHAYPSVYPETSCLTQIEAMSAGCYTVITNLGALPETSMGYGTIVPIEELTPEKYAEELTKAIISIKENGYDYSMQVQDIQNNFSWDKAKENWLKLDEMI